jgi:glutathione synthase/RimK-type ligase-like ATP-grasp enzyme
MSTSILTHLPAQDLPPLIGVPTLATLAFRGDDLSAIGQDLLARINDPSDANALMDLSVVLLLRGQPEESRAMQQLAIRSQQLYHYPRPATPPVVRVLAIFGPGDLMANSPLEFLLEDQPVALDLLFVTPEQGLPDLVPDHDVLMVAIGESDQNQPLLARLERELTDWPRPVINRPARISTLSRDGVCGQLSKLPGIVIPPTLRIARDTLEHCCEATANGSPLSQQLAGLDYPVIVRPVDSHAGSGLSRIATAAELQAYLADSPVDQFFISNFIDYRSADGRFRKCRIMLIDGVAYVSHMAVSGRWMVHYLNADMLASAAHREEEARFMEEFENGFARRHAAALQAIHQQLGLEYVGIDCAETPDGQLLVFEVDSNMVVHNMDPAETFPYKKIWMPRLFAAFTQMLVRRAAPC